MFLLTQYNDLKYGSFMVQQGLWPSQAITRGGFASKLTYVVADWPQVLLTVGGISSWPHGLHHRAIQNMEIGFPPQERRRLKE